MGVRETAVSGGDDAAHQDPVTAAEIDARMRRLLGRASSDDAAAHPAAHPPRDVDTACELLERASEAFDVLMERCGRLERELADAGVQARARDAEHEEAVALWQRLAGTFKAQAEAHEHAVAALQERCAVAEARVAALELANAEAGGRAGLAEQLATKLHDKVVTSFGIGSRAHPALEALALRETGAARRPAPASGKSAPRV